ncbi:MAG: hypothetical protein BAJATHORv1_10172 [Candidatus Thorarchaeota archaeon]|nr:MAG: hypothetical protein BAJATHORv1_10172 [Candidatus Thorarchaeota archaeon]
MAKYRDHPSGEWPFYPRLKEGDIEHEYWTSKKMAHQAFINDRKGRVVVLMDGEKYDKFLAKVKERKGNIWASSVDDAIHEAIDEWLKKED